VADCLARRHFVTNVDLVNYAADRIANDEFKAHQNYRHLKEDIATLGHLPEATVVNFAAESRRRSIADSRQFLPLETSSACSACSS
jgi:dTDP-glucose 4,6-dehydratase